MKILYIHQYFKTPSEGGAIRSYYIARGMIAAGHHVEMVTAHNEKKYSVKNLDGITVHYLPVKYENYYGFIRRLYAFLIFAHKAYYLSRTFQNIELVYVTSTPLTVALTALKLKKTHRIPFIFEVRDLWPEAPIKIGALRNPLLKFLAGELESETYKQASKIVALSPGILDYISSKHPEKPILLLPNMSDCGFFETSQIRDRNLLQKHNIQNELVIGYFGAVGKANALEYLLDLAEVSMDLELNIKFLLIGHGSELSKVKRKAFELELTNLEFIPHMDKYELKRYFSIIDAAYVSFADYPVLEWNSPNKFFDALAGGKPVITNTRGWIRDLVEKHECGFFIAPGESRQFISWIMDLMNTTTLRRYQANARRLGESAFERQMLLKRLLDFIEH